MHDNLNDTVRQYRHHTDARLVPVIIDGRHLRLDQYFNPIVYPRFSADEQPVTIDVCIPVTSPRLAAIAKKYGALTICVSDWRFYNRDNGNEYTRDWLKMADLDEVRPKIIKIDYRYNLQKNRLLIYRNNNVVYAYDDGKTCTDVAMLGLLYKPIEGLK